MTVYTQFDFFFSLTFLDLLRICILSLIFMLNKWVSSWRGKTTVHSTTLFTILGHVGILCATIQFHAILIGSNLRARAREWACVHVCVTPSKWCMAIDECVALSSLFYFALNQSPECNNTYFSLYNWTGWQAHLKSADERLSWQWCLPCDMTWMRKR